MLFTDTQNQIIKKNSNCRLVVDAGPGTGKTAVLCARVAYLILNLHVSPSSIKILSFTRTAVFEMRQRISEYFTDQNITEEIKIETIDSFSWKINKGFGDTLDKNKSFDDSIREVTYLLQTDTDAKDYIFRTSHLLIDEAQDVVGPRIELLLEFITALNSDTGVTIFCDQAQSIFGYSEDDDVNDLDGNLPDAIRNYMPNFEWTKLVHNHRSLDANILKISTEGREFLNTDTINTSNHVNKMVQIILKNCTKTVGSVTTDFAKDENIDDDTFLLFRRRGDVLMGSKLLGTKKHRIRMSGLPILLEEWLGLIFWDYTQKLISIDKFKELWAKRIPIMFKKSKENAWHDMLEIAGHDTLTIDLEKLRKHLSGKSPPINFCKTDFGTKGPLISTIHASKGREAQDVRLYIPYENKLHKSDKNRLNEAKVLFVGATRAKKTLKVGRSTMSYAARLNYSGRAYTRASNPPNALNLEVGRFDDISADGLVGKKFFETSLDVKNAQRLIGSNSNLIKKVRGLRTKKETEYRYKVVTEENKQILILSTELNRDLFALSRLMKKKSFSREIKDLKIMGIRTIVLAPNNESLQDLHEPWSNSGFMLAPLLTGYGEVIFY